MLKILVVMTITTASVAAADDYDDCVLLQAIAVTNHAASNASIDRHRADMTNAIRVRRLPAQAQAAQAAGDAANDLNTTMNTAWVNYKDALASYCATLRQ